MNSLSNTVNLNVKVNNDLKQQAGEILNDLGLNMSVAINMFLTQVVKRNGIPFEIVQETPNKKLLKALREAEEIANDKNRKGYQTIEELFKALDD